ncbi:hypothetical protein EHN07_05270 [Buttiauxella warmboldiae]|uniref:Type II secretion system protein GspC N-terminal domain-containing protein n=1 Tax=Buttiauxella warmboldiae TaxID=82993 RepID=A0A3N5DVG7_9ENTR|nr:hypothetical protein [Buttiauxella warmboldiae]RPH29620.1 hypothetical protein EHN07_05270 [Buttiauxella warmboldiae]
MERWPQIPVSAWYFLFPLSLTLLTIVGYQWWEIVASTSNPTQPYNEVPLNKTSPPGTLNLFVTKKEIQIEPRTTPLPYASMITVKGILQSNNNDLSWVIMKINNKQSNYGRGMSLDMFDNVTVARINEESVTLSTPTGDIELLIETPSYFKK